MFVKAGGLDGRKADIGKVDVKLYVKYRVGFLSAAGGSEAGFEDGVLGTHCVGN